MAPEELDIAHRHLVTNQAFDSRTGQLHINDMYRPYNRSKLAEAYGKRDRTARTALAGV